MHEVEPWFTDVDCRTRVWVSQAVVEAAADYFRTRRAEQGPWLAKLKYYAMSGFELFEGHGKPISPEWGGVFRIAIKRGLFRIIGFYDGVGRDDFIAIDAFLKKGQDLTRPQRERIDGVAQVRGQRLWKRKGEPWQRPRN